MIDIARHSTHSAAYQAKDATVDENFTTRVDFIGAIARFSCNHFLLEKDLIDDLLFHASRHFASQQYAALNIQIVGIVEIRLLFTS